MSQSEAILPVQRLEVLRPVVDVEVPSLPLPAATEAQTRAMDDVFADKAEEPRTLIDAVNFAAAAMLLHDVVKDTLAPPENDDEDEQPQIKPKEEE